MNAQGQPFIRTRAKPIPPKIRAERLVSAAIIRGGVTHDNGSRSHYALRNFMGDASPMTSPPGDIEGFMTSTGRFVDRREAQLIGEGSGQCRPQGRPLLSSDINW